MQPKTRILIYYRIGYPRNGKSYEAQTVLPKRFKAQLVAGWKFTVQASHRFEF